MLSSQWVRETVQKSGSPPSTAGGFEMSSSSGVGSRELGGSRASMYSSGCTSTTKQEDVFTAQLAPQRRHRVIVARGMLTI